jgi:hypothetical protein
MTPWVRTPDRPAGRGKTGLPADKRTWSSGISTPLATALPGSTVRGLHSM